MKRNPRKRLRLSQQASIRPIVVTLSIGALIAVGTVLFVQLKQTNKAKASTDTGYYTLDWSNPATYSINEGDVDSKQWNVIGQSCSFSSPVINSGGIPGQPGKIAEIRLRIRNGGNLEGDDTCQVNFLVNGITTQTYSICGDAVKGVYSLSHNLSVPSDGNCQVLINMKNDKPNESWYMKNGDVSIHMKENTPASASLANFNAFHEKKGTIAVRWMTYSEVNNSYFLLERSDNETDFSQLMRIDGAGNSSDMRKYEFIDHDPLPKKNYYRLRQFSSNGTSTLSDAIAASNDNSVKLVTINHVYPSPFTDRFTIDFTASAEQHFTLLMLSGKGKIVYAKSIYAFKGSNSVLIQPDVAFENGTYTIPLLFGNEVAGASRINYREEFSFTRN